MKKKQFWLVKFVVYFYSNSKISEDYLTWANRGQSVVYDTLVICKLRNLTYTFDW